MPVHQQGSDAIATLQKELPFGASTLHPLLSQAVGLAVFHVLFELKAVTTLDPDTEPQIQWLAGPSVQALQFLIDLAVGSGKTAPVAAAQMAVDVPAEAHAALPDGLLPVPAKFLQPTAALLHAFAVQMLTPRQLHHLAGQPQMRLYPAMNTIEANRWWPELLERVSGHVGTWCGGLHVAFRQMFVSLAGLSQISRNGGL